MAYDEGLAQRIGEVLDELAPPGRAEKRMFGGIGYLIQGNMACGVHKEYLIVRVGSARYQEALAAPHTRVFDMTARAMRGWVMVSPDGCASDPDLRAWVQQGVDFSQTLPPK